MITTRQSTDSEGCQFERPDCEAKDLDCVLNCHRERRSVGRVRGLRTGVQIVVTLDAQDGLETTL